MPPEDPTARLLEAQILEALEGLDLTSADGRAGINTLLSEIERACPGAILRQAAGIELRALGWRRDASRPDDGRDASRPDDGRDASRPDDAQAVPDLHGAA